MGDQEIIVGEGALGLRDIRSFGQGRSPTVSLSSEAKTRIRQGEQLITERLESGEVVYAVNTGVGPLAGSRIDEDQLEELQRRLVMSNCAGVGEPLPEPVVKRAMLLKVLSLASGNCGVSLALVETLVEWLNRGMTPVVPSQGSCGASGDLAPLAHVAASLCGMGEVWFGGVRLESADALQRAGMASARLGAKEGAALTNGTEISTALCMEGLFRAEDCLATAIVSGAMTVDAGGGTASAYDPRIARMRGQEGEAAVADAYRALLTGSEMQLQERDRIQDPYCLRCQPQVVGAALDQIIHCSTILEREIGAVTDNPLVCLDSGDLLYGGNFHAQPIGLAADSLALGVAEIGAIAERRVAYLVDENFSGLPPFLVSEGGLNSGFMLAQVTAAALVSENKALATPGSTDSIPTGANSEDYVSMATYAARRLGDMTANLQSILAIELLAASQAVDLRRPLRTSDQLEHSWSTVRELVDRWDKDRMLAPDIELLRQAIADRRFVKPELLTLLPSMAA